jgi:drug/metabolite transporter (DMT)-like permease
VVTLGAAVLFREEVGWQRWLAMAVGFVGVMIVIRPGLEGFEPASLWAVLAVGGLSVRDVSTRRVPSTIVTMHLAFSGFVAVGVLGTGMLLVTGGVIVPTQLQLGHLAGALASGIISYWAITEAMRVGDVSVVAPFRYSRLIFALIIGVLAFRERPDFFTLLGATLIITSGLYTLNRERQRRRDSRIPK